MGMGKKMWVPLSPCQTEHRTSIYRGGGWWAPLGLKAKLVRVFSLPIGGNTWEAGHSAAAHIPGGLANASCRSPHAHSFSAVSRREEMVAPPTTRALGQGSSEYMLPSKVIGSPQRAPHRTSSQPGVPGKRTTYLATDRGRCIVHDQATQHGHPPMTYEPSLAMRTTAQLGNARATGTKGAWQASLGLS